MNMNDRKNLGRRGEALAKKYLEKIGYRVIANNYRSGRREIDIIARRHREVVFVEVKTRAAGRESRTENPLAPRQIRNLKLAALDYCHKNRVALDAVRLDLIIILADAPTGRAGLRHYRDIF
jgi:putative endonuclease